MTEKPYNVDLLMQVREKIVNEPEKHNQTEWAIASSDPANGGDCGTAYCVAGWAAVLDGQKLAWAHFEYGDESYYEAVTTDRGEGIAAYAQTALGLERLEGAKLFAGSNSRDYVLAALDRLIEAGKNGERIPEGEL